MRSPRVAVIIPALNEALSLPKVLENLPPVARVLVVDNGSTDATAQVALSGGAEVYFEGRRGYGSAVQRGIQALASNPPDVVVILDADFSDDPSELPLLLAPLHDPDVHMVIGSRTLGNLAPGALLPQQRFGNYLTTQLISKLYRQHFTDLGPFRAIRYSTLLTLDLIDPDFGWNVEMQVKAVKLGFRIVEVPVSYRKRIGVSKISGTISGTVRAGIKILSTVARLHLS